jgi:Tol biopolymer transport system component
MELIVIPFDGGQPIFRHPVSSEVVNRNCLRWTPDGKNLAYLMEQDGIRNIWIKTLDDSPPVQLTRLSSQNIYQFSWSRDGKYLAYASGVMDDDVVLIRNFK